VIVAKRAILLLTAGSTLCFAILIYGNLAARFHWLPSSIFEQLASELSGALAPAIVGPMLFLVLSVTLVAGRQFATKYLAACVAIATLWSLRSVVGQISIYFNHHPYGLLLADTAASVGIALAVILTAWVLFWRTRRAPSFLGQVALLWVVSFQVSAASEASFAYVGI
jgi:hypothetical protein